MTQAATSNSGVLPPALQPLLSLATELRAHGFAVAPDQTIDFIAAVDALGPSGIVDVRRAAIALFAIPPERIFEFEAIFQRLFYGQSVAAAADAADDEVDAFEPTGGEQQTEVQASDTEAGIEAVDVEQLRARDFSSLSDVRQLAAFERQARNRLPQRQSYRWASRTRGSKLDLRRTLKAAVRRDGEVIDLAWLKRKRRQRRIVLLIDVSGSMKERSGSTLHFAHSLMKVADTAEVFTLGTRLTRITPAIDLDDSSRALQRVSSLVADFDGGTRIGDALQAFLSVPRYAGFARGAAVVVVSDGLERGDSQAMVESCRRLSRLAWRLSWLTPLAGDEQYQIRTEALQQVLPVLHQLGAAHSIEAMCSHVLNMAKNA